MRRIMSTSLNAVADLCNLEDILHVGSTTPFEDIMGLSFCFITGEGRWPIRKIIPIKSFIDLIDIPNAEVLEMLCMEDLWESGHSDYNYEFYTSAFRRWSLIDDEIFDADAYDGEVRIEYILKDNMSGDYFSVRLLNRGYDSIAYSPKRVEPYQELVTKYREI